MTIVDSGSPPVALYVEGASPYESQLIIPTLQARYTRNLLHRLIGDKAYDSDPLREKLRRRYQCELIAPHK